MSATDEIRPQQGVTPAGATADSDPALTRQRDNGRGMLAGAFDGTSPLPLIKEGNAAPPPAAQWCPFPVDALPSQFASYVADTARARQCDPAAVALPLLAALAGTIGNARRVQIGADWFAPSVLWTAIVAPSGAVKSPPFRAALAPAQQIEADSRKKWEDKYGDPRSARMQHDADVAQWRKDQAGEPPPSLESVPRLLVDDITLEALAGILADNPRGVLQARDELSGWVRSFDKYSGSTGADQARYLEMYSAQSLRVDRKGDGHVYVRRAAVSITGTIQTDILPRVFSDEHQASGLMARFLLASPPEPSRSWDAIRKASVPDISAVLIRFRALRILTLPEAGNPPFALELTREAAELYGRWFHTHEGRRRGTESGSWRSALAKLEELPGRLGLVLSLAGASEPQTLTAVGGDTMRRAIELAEWFTAEGRRIYSNLSETNEERADRELVEWVGQNPDVTARDAALGMRRYRGPGGMERARDDLCRLVDEGRLETFEIKKSRGPSVAVHRVPPPSTSTGLVVPQRENGKPVDVDTVDATWETLV